MSSLTHWCVIIRCVDEYSCTVFSSLWWVNWMVHRFDERWCVRGSVWVWIEFVKQGASVNGCSELSNVFRIKVRGSLCFWPIVSGVSWFVKSHDLREKSEMQAYYGDCFFLSAGGGCGGILVRLVQFRLTDTKLKVWGQQVHYALQWQCMWLCQCKSVFT